MTWSRIAPRFSSSPLIEDGANDEGPGVPETVTPDFEASLSSIPVGTIGVGDE
jgi:hypothetical protein